MKSAHWFPSFECEKPSIDLMKQIFYVLDKDHKYMVPLNGALINKRIRIASKLRITQILSHDYTVIDSRKFGQQDIICVWNKTREARNE